MTGNGVVKRWQVNIAEHAFSLPSELATVSLSETVKRDPKLWSEDPPLSRDRVPGLPRTAHPAFGHLPGPVHHGPAVDRGDNGELPGRAHLGPSK